MPKSSLHQFGKRSKQAAVGATSRAVIYTRVSTKEQADTNQSLELQEKKCQEYAAHRGYTVVEQFGGTYESAKTDGRKEFTRMLTFVRQKANGISHIIVLSPDRFSRTGGDAIALTAQLRKAGVAVETVTQQADTSTAMGRFMQDFGFVMSHFDNQMRKDRAVLGMKERLRDGHWTFKPPLGYIKVKQGSEQQIVISPHGELLRKAFLFKINGQMSNAQLVAWLRKRGVKLSEKLLTQTFRNPFYCGLISSSLLDGEVVKGRHPGLITEEQFLHLNNLQQQQEHGHAHAKEVPTVPLKHHVRCHRCGKPLTAYEVKAKKLWYYKCNTRGCKLNIGARQLHGAYHDLLAQFSVAPDLIEPLKDLTAGVFHQLNQESVQERKAVEAELKQVQQKLEKMEERYALGELNRATYEKFYQKIATEELQPVQARYAQLAADLSNLKIHTDFSVEMAAKLPTMWNITNLFTRQQMQHMLDPGGIAFAPETGLYRTGRANTIFETIASFSTDNHQQKTGLNTAKRVKSSLVGPTGIEPVTC